MAQDGKIVKVVWGRFHAVAPDFDRGIERQLKDYFERYHTIRMENFRIGEDEMLDFGHNAGMTTHPCRR